jgi:hypothetical protein
VPEVQTNHNPFEGYHDAQECLRMLFPSGGCCLRTFRKLHAQGFLPHLKLGRSILYKPSEVVKALERNFKVLAVS